MCTICCCITSNHHPFPLTAVLNKNASHQQHQLQRHHTNNIKSIKIHQRKIGKNKNLFSYEHKKNIKLLIVCCASFQGMYMKKYIYNV